MKKKLTIIVSIILIAIFCISITPVSMQNDTFYTIKVGEQISKYGIDMQDHFSWHDNLPYTYPHWLYDLLTYFIFLLFDFKGIYITTCILSCILGISLYFVSSKISKNNLISFVTTIGALYLIKGYITARAQLVTFILFVLALYCIEMFLENRKIRYAIGLVIISLLIANLHCAVWLFLFIMFLPYIAEYLISLGADILIYRKISLFILNLRIKSLKNKNKNKEKLSKLQEKQKQIQDQNKKIKNVRDKDLENPYKIRITKNKNTKWLIVILIACVLVGFLTPIGTTPFTYLIKTMQTNTIENINEHLPMTLSNHTEILVSLIIFLAILIFTKIKIKLCDLLMLGGLTYLMLLSRRQLSMFSIIGSLILAKLLVDFVNVYFKNGEKGFNDFFSDIKTLVLASCLTLCLSYYQCKDKFDDEFIEQKSYPVQACDFILENIDLGKARFFNEYNYGSYMLLRGIPVFIDSRADLYSPKFNGLEDDIFMDFIEVSNISKFYDDVFDKYDITHVILFKDSKVNMIIEKTNDSNYKELYSDDHFIIYKRQNI